MFEMFSDFESSDEFASGALWTVRGKKEDIENLAIEFECDESSLKEICPGIYETQLEWEDIDFQIAKDFLVCYKDLKIAGLLPRWDNKIEVYAFYSAPGSEDAEVDFIAYSDGHNDDCCRWYYNVEVTEIIDAKENWSCAGDYDTIIYQYPWRKEWNLTDNY